LAINGSSIQYHQMACWGLVGVMNLEMESWLQKLICECMACAISTNGEFLWFKVEFDNKQNKKGVAKGCNIV